MKLVQVEVGYRACPWQQVATSDRKKAAEASAAGHPVWGSVYHSLEVDLTPGAEMAREVRW